MSRRTRTVISATPTGSGRRRASARISGAAGAAETAGMMPDVTETKALRPVSGDRAPADWGLGDGQAVPWEYAPAPESREIVSLKPRYGLFINGREVGASDGGRFT